MADDKGMTLDELTELDKDDIAAAQQKADGRFRKGAENPNSKYDPSLCEIWIEMGKEGRSIRESALIIGIERRTAHSWMKAYPEFQAAEDQAKDWRISWYERRRREVAGGLHKGNAGLIDSYLQKHAPEEYGSGKQEVDIGQNALAALMASIGQQKLDLAGHNQKEDDDVNGNG